MKRANLFLFALLLALPTAAQKPYISQAPMGRNLRAHVEYLASDKLEGRRTGEQGATNAAVYIRNQFREIKLKPGVQSSNRNEDYLQKFPYISGVTLGADN